jgi:hypothetical protein
MNCENCQEYISRYLDGDLDELISVEVTSHISVCSECALLYEDFSAILANCGPELATEEMPPNSKALWCRINNVIEADVEARPHVEPEPAKQGWFARGWNLTFSQAGAAVLGVAVISSLLTVVAVRNYLEPTGDDFTSRSKESQTTFEKVLSTVGLIDSPETARVRRVAEQQSVIDYWNKRVQTRRQQWDAKMRDAFDRNVNELDQAVHEYTLILEKDPNDDLSGEMLDSALNDKMKLLREFAEL